MKTSLLLAALAALATSAKAENWPRFRGPTGQGISTEHDLPLVWSATEKIVWKTEIPGEGWSSPIVWGNAIFLTTATESGASCRVLALDRRNGKILWDTEVFRQELKRKEGKNSFATPTAVTDGESVFAVFGGGGIAALQMDGAVRWTNRDVKFYSQHGLGASPVLHADLLIMPFDGSSEGEDKVVGWQKPWDRSFILALDKINGAERWRARRGMSRIAHGTPVFATVDGRDLMLSNAGDVVQGFDPTTGQRLWSVYCQGEGVVPSLSVGNGVVFSSSGFEKSTIRAIRFNARQASIAWEQTKGVPKQASMLYAAPYLYSIADGGVAMCQQAETGEVVWQERIGGTFCASPIAAQGRIYFLSEQGETTVVEAAPQFKVLARNPLSEKCQASPAASQGQLFIRTERHLYCLGR
jgi:outer membrane protein assembly factor BamB